MLKILHLADVHLDTVFAGRSERVRKRLREAIREAFVAAMDVAIAGRVDAVVIAGDMVEADHLSFTTEKLLFEQVSRVAETDISVFYAPGNHDPASRGSRLAGMRWPEAMHVFRGARPEAVDILSNDGTVCGVVVGAGHQSPRQRENLAALFPVSSGAVPHVGLLHTMVQSAVFAEQHDRYAPCELADLRRVGYDYWALGHIHTRQEVDDRANAWYPGNLVGRNPRETGPRGALLAHVERGKPAVTEFVPLAGVEWQHLVIESLAGIRMLNELEAATREAFDAATQDSTAREFMVTVDLRGPCPLALELRDPERREEMEELLAGALAALEVEIRVAGLRSPVDVASYADKPHALGEVLATLSAVATDEALLEKVAPEALAQPLGDGRERTEYLRSLLDGLDEEAVLAFLGDRPEAS